MNWLHGLQLLKKVLSHNPTLFQDGAGVLPTIRVEDLQAWMDILSYVLITPARNEADFIVFTLKSVVAQNRAGPPKGSS